MFFLRLLNRRRLIFLGATSLAAGLLIAGWASVRITAAFEARERNSASRLLGRAFPLAPGLPASSRDLVRRLDRLGYRRARGEPSDPGTYVLGRGTAEIHTRAFRDPEGNHSSGIVRVELDGDRIAAVDPAGGSLEPETIAFLQGPNLEERDPVDLAGCPKHLLGAILAAEDRRFFLHPGIDPAGIARAIWADLSSRSLSQGGSTLTQQLAKNLYFTGERTLARKIAEAFAAIVLEARYSKERILRAYVNEIYLGQRGPASVRGVARAARLYFGKNVADLTLAESALLAGMIRAPGLYNPFLHTDRARERRDAVLRAMVETGAITEEQRAAAEREPIRVKRPGDRPGQAPGGARAAYVADLVRQDLEGTYGSDLSGLGLRVHTSIDPIYQEEAEEAVAQGLSQIVRQYRSLRRRGNGHPLQAALVAVDLRDGGIVAMIGGRDFGASQFNRATSARRQPGSLFKPVVYLAGLTHPGDDEPPAGGAEPRRKEKRRHPDYLVAAPELPEIPPGAWVHAKLDRGDPIAQERRHRWWWQRDKDRSEDEESEDGGISDVPRLPLTAATILMDEPYEVRAGGRIWSPRNDDDTFRGPVTVQRAIEESLNVPTARAAAAIGLARVVATARSLGIRSPLPEVPSIALGSAEVTPMEMATVFTTIASGGRHRDLRLLRGVEDPKVDLRGAAAAGEPPTDQAVPRVAAAVMTALLEGVIDNGTGRAARTSGFEGAAAGKTGTSDGGRDLWFCGYTPSILTLVWVGFDDGSFTGLTGSRGAVPIWVEFMKRIGAGTGEPFASDEEVAWAEIDPTTGGLAGRSCPETRLAPFIPGTEPTEKCRDHRSFWERWFD